MCLGVPFKVLSVDNHQEQLEVQAFGEQRTISTMLLDRPVIAGEFVLVQAGGFATDVLSEKQAKESLSLLEKLELINHERS